VSGEFTICVDRLSPAAVGHIEEVCDRFEAAWRTGGLPRIEDYLCETPEPERSALLGELLVLELAYRRRHGDRPTSEGYRRRFPEHGELIRSVGLTSDQLGADSPPVPVPAEEDRALVQLSAVPLPTSIGKYRVVERLGQGGQAEVFRAVHPNLPGRDVVIKWARHALPAPLQQKVIEEAQVLARLEDPGIVRIFDADVHEGRPFLVLEHVAGCNLSERLKRDGLPHPRESVALVARLARTLAVLHQHSVLHLDLKPANILMDTAGSPRLVDFGLAARIRTGDEPGEQAGSISGTLSYMAPEQAWPQTDQIGPRTDVFGLGAVLYELLTGRPPYRAPSRDAFLALARQARVIPPRQLNRRISRSLERTCLKSLARDPAHRYASAAHLERALRFHLRRRSLITATSGLAALLVAGTIVASLHLSSPQSQDPLTLRVGSRHNPWLSLEQTGALPVRNGDLVRLEVRLSRPAYIYLLSIDSQGLPQPLYPWYPEWGFAKPPRSQTACKQLDSPPEGGHGWEVDGAGGLETAILLARDTPLPPSVDMESLVGTLPKTSCSDLREGYYGYGWRLTPNLSSPLFFSLAQHRGLKPESSQIDDPLVQLIERLRHDFPLIEVVRFAHACN
jgi:serine/threonine protein kinase